MAEQKYALYGAKTKFKSLNFNPLLVKMTVFT